MLSKNIFFISVKSNFNHASISQIIPFWHESTTNITPSTVPMEGIKYTNKDVASKKNGDKSLKEHQRSMMVSQNLTFGIIYALF